MKRRTPDDWKVLIDKQMASGLSVPQFCQQHQLNTKYFYTRKSLLNQTMMQTDFAQAQVVSQQTTLVSQHAAMTLKTVAVELSLPTTTSPEFLSELIKGIAS